MSIVIPQEQWQPGTLRNGDVAAVRWLPISVLDREIGLTDDGQWVYALHGELLPIAGGQDLVHLFPFLDISEMEFRGVMRMSLLSLGVPMESGDTFPYDLIVAGAIDSRSPYWSGRALNWLEQGLPITPAISHAMEEFVGEKRGTHRDRHRAFRLLQWWRKGAARTVMT